MCGIGIAVVVSLRVNLFMGVDVRGQAVGQHPRAHPTGCSEIVLLHASLPGQRREGYRAARAHYVDRLPFWRPTSMVMSRLTPMYGPSQNAPSNPGQFVGKRDRKNIAVQPLLRGLQCTRRIAQVVNEGR
jgi:hypothetical protein